MTTHLKAQFLLLKAIRSFFEQDDFIDVITPPVVENPGMETHIHPFQLIKARNNEQTDRYLHTSPEFHMKELLSQGFEKIFTLSYCFRDEPDSPIHRSQFLMLEWYRSQARYEQIMQDCQELTLFCYEFLKKNNIEMNPKLENAKFQKLTVQEIFQEILNIDILDFLEVDAIRSLLTDKFKDIPVPSSSEQMEWDDYFFLLFLNKIEPQLTNYPFLILYEFPCHLSALSTLKKDDPRVCERFEIYIDGVELANCFNELIDLETQKKRFAEQAEIKKKLYNYSLPSPSVLYNAMAKGLPPSAGIALGVERFLISLTKLKNGFWS